jgi:hypothetical protein
MRVDNQLDSADSVEPVDSSLPLLPFELRLPSLAPGVPCSARCCGDSDQVVASSDWSLSSTRKSPWPPFEPDAWRLDVGP